MIDPLAFALAVVALLAAPGPTNALLAIAGAGGGWRDALPSVLAAPAAYLLAIAALTTALAPLAAHLPAVMTALRIACALYLMVVSVKLWRYSYQRNMATTPVSASAIFTTTLLNPKGFVLATSVFPTGLGAFGLAPYFAGFATLCVAISLGWFSLGALANNSNARAHCIFCRVGSLAMAGFSGLLSAAALG